MSNLLSRKTATQIILPDLKTLAQYANVGPVECSKKSIAQRCSCGVANSLRPHGCYHRKPDRHAEAGTSLNPVKILRFICNVCRITCSALPECIPPRRWYLWQVQQLVVQERLLGHSWHSISRKFKVSRSTCRRWVQSLQDEFNIHADVLRNVAGKLGTQLVHCFDVKSFWQSCLAQIDLSRAMLLCHGAGINIP